MYDFSSIIERLKAILAHQTGQSKVKDKELAAALGLRPEYFAVIKKRGKIPYGSIIRYCTAHDICCNWVFEGKHPKGYLPFDLGRFSSYNKSA